MVRRQLESCDKRKDFYVYPPLVCTHENDKKFVQYEYMKIHILNNTFFFRVLTDYLFLVEIVICSFTFNFVGLY